MNHDGAAISHYCGVAMRSSRQGGGEGVGRCSALQHAGAGAQIYRDRGGGVHNACHRARRADNQVFKVATAGRGDGGLQAAGVLVDVFTVDAAQHQRAAGLTVMDHDRALVGHHRGVALRRRRQGGGEGVGRCTAFQHAGAGAQVHRDRGGRIDNRCSCSGAADDQALKVAATGRGDSGLQAAGVFVNVLGIGAGQHQGAAGRAVSDGDRSFVGDDGSDALRGCRQGGGEGVGGCAAFQHTGAGAQIDRDRVDRVNNGGGGRAGTDIDMLKIAAAGRGDGGLQTAGVFVDVFAVGAGHDQRAAGLAVVDHDRSLVSHHRGVALRWRRQGGGEGVGGGATLGDAAAGREINRDRRDGVVDNGDDVGVIHGDIGEATARHRAHGDSEGFGVLVNVFTVHRHQNRPAAGARRNGDDGAIAQGDGHAALGHVFQRGGVGDAGAAFSDGTIGRQVQRGFGYHDPLLRRDRLAACAIAVVVRQRINPFCDAQQLHKGAAAVGTTTRTHAGRSGFQGLVQVGAALQCLNDGVCRGRAGYCAVLRRRALIGFAHVVVQAHALGRGHGQRATVFHHEFDPDIAHGANGFAFLQFITHLEGTAHALGVDCEYGTVAVDGGEGCK